MHLIIRADATASMGTGHVMRCMALALAAKEHGLDVCMLSYAGVDWVRQRLHNENVNVLLLDTPPAAKELPDKLLADLARVAQRHEPRSCWVVLDGYHFGPDCQKAARNSGYRLITIDDYAHLPEYSCDILLNQNIGAELLAYSGNIGQKLLGLRYVLMRPEFAEARAKAIERVFSELPQNILLTLGGGDFSGPLRQLAPSFCIPEMTGRILRIIRGAIPERVIQECLRDCPARIEILSCVDNMPALMLDTDLCVTAGGSTCWELCCLGVPFLPLIIADNQKNIVKKLEDQSITSQFTGARLQKWLQNPYLFRAASQAGTKHVDGYGGTRVLMQLCRGL